MEEQLEKWWSALSEEDRDYLTNTEDDKVDTRTANLLMRGPVGPVTVGWTEAPDSFVTTFPTSVREFIELKNSKNPTG